jgi:hypothetical protein
MNPETTADNPPHTAERPHAIGRSLLLVAAVVAAIALIVSAATISVTGALHREYPTFPESHKRGDDIVTQTDALFETKASNHRGYRVQDAIKRSGRTDITVQLSDDPGANYTITKITLIKSNLVISFDKPTYADSGDTAESIVVNLSRPSQDPIDGVFVHLMSKSTKISSGSPPVIGMDDSKAEKLAKQAVWDVLNTTADNWRD